MDVDCALVDVDVAAPYAVEQLLAENTRPGLCIRNSKQPELGRAEMNLASVRVDAMGLAVELDVARDQQVATMRRASRG